MIDDDKTIVVEQLKNDFLMDDKTVVATIGGNFELTDIALGDFPTDSEVKTYSDYYSLKGIVGEGGVGRVLLGVDRRIGREVAIKELLVGDSSAAKYVARFVREARITGKLEHPGIVPIYEIGRKKDGTIFYVMKNVKGETLSKLIAKANENSPPESLKKRLGLIGYLINICDAMAFSHACGVIHRDLKPANIIIGDYGETIILDWGLAKVLGVEAKDDFVQSNLADWGLKNSDGAKEAELTQQGEILGTPTYMAPEQVNNLSKIGTQADVYALGSILFQILTGKTPYSGSVKSVLSELVSSNPSPEPFLEGLSLPTELVAICRKAMAKNPEDRFANAEKMAEELKAFRDGRLVSVHSYSRKELLKRFIERNKVAVFSSFLVVLAILVGGVFSIHFGLEAKKAKEHAEQALKVVTLGADEALREAEISKKTFKQHFDKIEELLTKEALVIDGDKESSFARIKSAGLGISGAVLFDKTGKVVAYDKQSFKGLEGYTLSEDVLLKLLADKNAVAYSYIPSDLEDKLGHENRTLAIGYPAKDKLLAFLVHSEEVAPKALKSIIEVKEVKVWVMKEDGTILFDETNPEEIGLNLFKSEIYQDFPELAIFGRNVQKNDSGVGYYSFFDEGLKNRVYKIGAWSGFSPSPNVNWKIVLVKVFSE